VLNGFGAARPYLLSASGLGGLFSSSKSGSVINGRFLDTFVRDSLNEPGRTRAGFRPPLTDQSRMEAL